MHEATDLPSFSLGNIKCIHSTPNTLTESVIRVRFEAQCSEPTKALDPLEMSIFTSEPFRASATSTATIRIPRSRFRLPRQAPLAPVLTPEMVTKAQHIEHGLIGGLSAVAFLLL